MNTGSDKQAAAGDGPASVLSGADTGFLPISVPIRGGVNGVSPGPLAFAPMFAAGAGEGAPAFTDAVDAARRLGNPEIDPVSAMQDLVFGFRLGGRSVYRGVHRLLPGEAAVAGRSGLELTRWAGDEVDASGHDDSMAVLLRRVASLAGGHRIAAELTGGIDSRCALAIAIRAGCLPAFAFTLGEAGDPDVVVASIVAGRVGLRHVVLPFPSGCDPVDAHRYCAASGYASSASAYGWLPRVFASLGLERTCQLSGVGGERVGGFYATRLDGLSRHRMTRRLWARLRLRIPGSDVGLIRRSARASIARAVSTDLDAVLDGPSEDGPPLDALYTRHRLRQWAAPALAASSKWYAPLAPLMLPAFEPIARRIRSAGGDPRSGLLALAGELVPELAGIPLAGDVGVSIDLRGRKRRRVSAAVARVMQRRRPSPAVQRAAAIDLARHAPTVEAIRGLVASTPWLSAPDAERILADPASRAHELGFLAGWAWAADAAARPRGGS